MAISDEPLLNREVTQLMPRRSSARAANVSFVNWRAARGAPSQPSKARPRVRQSRAGWNGDGACNKKTCDPDSTS